MASQRLRYPPNSTFWIMVVTARSMFRTVSGVNPGAQASRHCQPKAMWRTSSRRISSMSRRTAGLVALCTVALNASIRISSAAQTKLAKMPSSEVSGSKAMRRTPCVPTAPTVGGFCGWGKYPPRRSAMSHDASACRPSSCVRMVKKKRRSGWRFSRQKRSRRAGLSEMAPYSPHVLRLQWRRAARICSSVYRSGRSSAHGMSVCGSHSRVLARCQSSQTSGMAGVSSSG